MVSSVGVGGSKLGRCARGGEGEYELGEKLSAQKMSRIMKEIRVERRKLSKVRSSSECRSSERLMQPKVTKNVFSPRK